MLRSELPVRRDLRGLRNVARFDTVVDLFIQVEICDSSELFILRLVDNTVVRYDTHPLGEERGSSNGSGAHKRLNLPRDQKDPKAELNKKAVACQAANLKTLACGAFRDLCSPTDQNPREKTI